MHALAFACGAFAGALGTSRAAPSTGCATASEARRRRSSGPRSIAAFRSTHRDPASIARHGLCERSGGNAFAALPVLLAAHTSLGGQGALGAAAFGLGAALSFAGYVALTNEIHLQAHRGARPRVVAWLQRLRLVLPPEQHALHHGGGHDRAFCIATGWSNALLDRLEIPARLERRLRRSA